MVKKRKSGSHRKADTDKYRKRRKREREHRVSGGIKRKGREAEFKARIQPRTDGLPTCPLCNQPFSLDDLMTDNIHTVAVNYKPVKVHLTCPGETA